jgi:type II secretory pathway component PulF
MMYVIRGTDEQSGQDISIVVEAQSRSEAEYMAIKRGVPVIIIEEARKADIEEAKANKLLWRSTHDQGPTAFGRPVSRMQLVSLMLCGILTSALVLRAEGIRNKGRHMMQTKFQQVQPGNRARADRA